MAGTKPLLLPSQALHKHLGHRGVLHSLRGLEVFALIVSPVMLWSGWLIWAALVLGYGTHLVGDSCTRSGIPLLYPKPQKYRLLPFRLVTGSLAEEVIFVLLALTILLLLLQYLPLSGGSSF